MIQGVKWHNGDCFLDYHEVHVGFYDGLKTQKNICKTIKNMNDTEIRALQNYVSYNFNTIYECKYQCNICIIYFL